MFKEMYILPFKLEHNAGWQKTFEQRNSATERTFHRYQTTITGTQPLLQDGVYTMPTPQTTRCLGSFTTGSLFQIRAMHAHAAGMFLLMQSLQPLLISLAQKALLEER